MSAEMEERWVVCCGAVEFASIACALSLGARARRVTWEPDAVNARDDLEYGPLGVTTHVVVGAGCLGGDPFEVACDLAARSKGRTVLCLSGAAALSETAASRGLTAAVDPAGLTRLMCAIGAEDLARNLRGRRPEEPGAESGPKEAEAGVPEVELSVPAGASDLPVAAEPLVRVPILNLSQNFECKVAGADAPVPTIAFASARGGVGKSSLAVVSALALARSGLNVALVDMDFQFGTCLGYLGSGETDGLVDATGSAAGSVRVDARTIARCRTTPESRLAAYGFCRLPEQAELLGSVSAELVRSARAGCDVAVVDLPSGVNETVAQVLELADRCLFVADQGALSLESMASQQALCGRLGIPRAKLVTVMNRCDPRHRDEGFLSRVDFKAGTSQIVRVLDGGSEVTQMLSIGRAGELLNIQNKFAVSTQAMLAGLCADLGLQGPEDTRASRAPRRALERASGLVSGRFAVREGEGETCPF